MRFKNERDLENHLRHLITAKVTAKYPHVYALINKKAVDIVICRDGERPAVFFIEVKLYRREHGRLGIGTGGGIGYQPEIVARNPDYFEAHLRWVIADGRKPAASFLFVPTSTVREYLTGGEIGKKYNNIRLSIFREVTALDEDILVDQLCKWLLQ